MMVKESPAASGVPTIEASGDATTFEPPTTMVSPLSISAVTMTRCAGRLSVDNWTLVPEVVTVCLPERILSKLLSAKADPASPNPTNMRVKSDQPDSAGAEDKGDRYFLISPAPNIDQIAQAVRDWSGAMIGIYTKGWTDLNYPKPATTAGGGHALYIFGYHTHSDGKKCIIAKSSWCKVGHHTHHINEDHFAASRVYDGWVLVPKNNMVQRYVVNKNGKLGVCVSVDGDGVFSDVVYWAKSQQHLEQMKVQYEIPADAKVITYPN